jgi:hypothetical protein
MTKVAPGHFSATLGRVKNDAVIVVFRNKLASCFLLDVSLTECQKQMIV